MLRSTHEIFSFSFIRKLPIGRGAFSFNSHVVLFQFYLLFFFLFLQCEIIIYFFICSLSVEISMMIIISCMFEFEEGKKRNTREKNCEMRNESFFSCEELRKDFRLWAWGNKAGKSSKKQKRRGTIINVTEKFRKKWEEGDWQGIIREISLYWFTFSQKIKMKKHACCHSQESFAALLIFNVFTHKHKSSLSLCPVVPVAGNTENHSIMLL